MLSITKKSITDTHRLLTMSCMHHKLFKFNKTNKKNKNKTVRGTTPLKEGIKNQALNIN